MSFENCRSIMQLLKWRVTWPLLIIFTPHQPSGGPIEEPPLFWLLQDAHLARVSWKDHRCFIFTLCDWTGWLGWGAVHCFEAVFSSMWICHVCFCWPRSRRIQLLIIRRIQYKRYETCIPQGVHVMMYTDMWWLLDFSRSGTSQASTHTVDPCDIRTAVNHHCYSDS